MNVSKDLIKYISELDQYSIPTSALYLQTIDGCWLPLEDSNLNVGMELNINYLEKYFEEIKIPLIINDEDKIAEAHEANQLLLLFLITCPFFSDSQKKSFNWVKVNSLQESGIEISLTIDSQGQLLQILNY